MVRLNLKQVIIIILLLLFITNLSIILDVIILRPLFFIITFMVIPGFLIIEILNISMNEIFKKYIISVGLSVFVLLFLGFFSNETLYYVGIKNPISIFYLTLVFSSFVFLLLCLTYKIRKKTTYDIPIKELFFFRHDYNDLLYYFPLFIFFLSFFGIYIMNTVENNMIVLIALISMIIFMLYISNRKEVPENLYPYSILIISLSLLLMQSLRSYNLVGADIHGENLLASKIILDQYFQIASIDNLITSCLSVTILIPIISVFSNLSSENVIITIIPFLLSTIPLAVYYIAKNIMNSKYAFLSALLYISNAFLIIDGLSPVRTGVALFFFVLFLVVFLSDEFKGFAKNLLYIFFIFGVIFSHYSSSIVFAFIFLLVSLLIILHKLFEYIGRRVKWRKYLKH